MNNLYILLAVLLAMVGVEQYGEHRIQVEWDKDKAVRQAQLDTERKTNKETNDALIAQNEKDKQAAISKAGRDAVNRWLAEHGLLPDGSRMPSRADRKAEGSGVLNDSAGQSEPGSRIEEFAIGCAKDALMVLDFQSWITREGIKSE